MKDNVIYSYAPSLGAKPTFQDEPWETYCDKLLASAKRRSSTELKQMPDGQDYEAKFGCRKIWADLPQNMSGLFHLGTNRRNENVFHMGNVLIVDIDKTSISFEQMHDKLAEMNVCYALHTTTSHSVASPSYRIHVPVDEPIEIDEYPLAWGNLNDLLGGVFDPKTHDLARCMYLPRRWDGNTCQIKVETEKEFLTLSRLLHMVPTEPTCTLMKKQQRQVTAARKELSKVAKGFGSAHSSVSLSTLVDDHAKSAYATHEGGRCYTFMRRVAANAHFHSIGIDPQDLANLALKEDAAHNITKKRVGILKEAQNAIDASLCELADKLHAANQNHAPLITPRSSNLVVEYIDAQCGQGKTWETLDHITKQRGLWIYACDKISTLNERTGELVLLNNCTANPSSLEFTKIYKGKIEKDAYGYNFEVDSAESVLKQISDAGIAMVAKKNVGKIDAGVIFISHRALTMMDWRSFGEFNLVIDEIPDAVTDYTRSLRGRSARHLAKYVLPKGEDSGSYFMGTTDSGRCIAEAMSFDDLEESFAGLIMMASDPATELYIVKSEWDRATQNKSTKKLKLGFFNLYRASSVANFNRVILLGDEVLKSRLCNAWSKIDGVNFVQAGYWSGGRKRVFDLKNRVTVHYFSEDNASLYRFNKEDDPLVKISKEIVKFETSKVLFSVNEKNQSKVEDLIRADAVGISPKSHGRNDLQDHSTLVWLACMKSSRQTREVYRDFLGMTSKQVDREKDLNACYQFIMRGVLRKFDSDERCEVYVFSKEQADYLRERLGGCPVNKIERVISKIGKKCGKPAKEKIPKPPKKPAMTPAERQRRHREKKRLAKQVANTNVAPSSANKNQMFSLR